MWSCISIALAIISLVMSIRNMWLLDRYTEINRFENGVHLIRGYVGYETAMWRFWVWDMEKLKKPKVG